MKKLAACLLVSLALLSPAGRAEGIDKDLAELLSRLGEAHPVVTPFARERVQRHLDALAKQKSLPATYERKQQRWPAIAAALKSRGLPEEAGYLAWAESGFDPKARSPLGSLGVWQFIPATARQFGLTVTPELDERTDAAKETRAATEYLAKLFGEFGKDAPLLALAAYNAGESAVHRALDAEAAKAGGQKPEHRDFFWLAERKLLPEEASEYVPTILAAALIGEHPERYGLK